MTKIDLLPYEQAGPATQELYSMLKQKLGRVPNIYQVYGHSASALKANLLMDDALSQGILTGREIEVVALVVSQYNGCDYCLAAHTALGKMWGMKEAETLDVRRGTSGSAKELALLQFTQALLEQKGRIAEQELNAFLEAGYTTGAVVEVIGQIAKNIFNNYTNHISGAAVDFPAAPSLHAAVVN